MADPTLPDEVETHYASGYEATRVTRDGGRIEFIRTRELLLRYLPPPPAVIYDVGGGPGAYALPLAQLGYEVHMLDALPLHVQLAQQASDAQPDAPLASVSLGDARTLDWEDGSADVVLLFGPLYHLTGREDRLTALREAHRVLRSGGLLLAVGVSRFASLMDGLYHGLLEDPVFERIVKQDLRNGQHRNPTNHPQYFTTAYFHTSEEMQSEIGAAGMRHEATLAVEGPAWLSQFVAERWSDPEWRERILEFIRLVEHEPSLLGASAHLMAIARKDTHDGE